MKIICTPNPIYICVCVKEKKEKTKQKQTNKRERKKAANNQKQQNNNGNNKPHTHTHTKKNPVTCISFKSNFTATVKDFKPVQFQKSKVQRVHVKSTCVWWTFPFPIQNTVQLWEIIYTRWDKNIRGTHIHWHIHWASNGNWCTRQTG